MLTRGFLGPRESASKQHLDGFSRFAGFASVSNTQTDTQTTERVASVAISYTMQLKISCFHIMSRFAVANSVKLRRTATTLFELPDYLQIRAFASEFKCAAKAVRMHFQFGQNENALIKTLSRLGCKFLDQLIPWPGFVNMHIRNFCYRATHVQHIACSVIVCISRVALVTWNCVLASPYTMHVGYRQSRTNIYKSLFTKKR